MSDHDIQAGGERPSASVRSFEIGTAIALFALGVILMGDSLRIGAGWTDDGPQSGYFPFYIGMLLCLASVVNLVSAVRNPETKTEVFLTRRQTQMVMELLVPTTVFVIAIGWLGIYVSSALLIGWFMRRLGRFAALPTLLVSLGIPGILFALFEIWFKILLPKGPLEQLLGLQ